ncbi:MAG: hypothetical protein ABIR96_10865 [Bdellovibrionota bacterium]
MSTHSLCRATEAECEAWLRKKIAPRPQILTRDITVYHWVPCKNVAGYKKNGDLAKLAAGYVKKQLENTRLTPDNRSGGLYLATDPSSSCSFGLSTDNVARSDSTVSSSCLIVIDISKDTPLLYSPSITLKSAVNEDHEDLLRWGCLNDSSPYTDLRAPLKPLLKPIGAIEAKDFIERIYASQPSLSFDYGALSIPHQWDLKQRALRLRSDSLARLKIRGFEANDLKYPQSDEARYIVRHLQLSDFDNCLDRMDANVVPRLSDKDRSPQFNAWLDNVVSQKGFSDVVRDAVLTENPLGKH